MKKLVKGIMNVLLAMTFVGMFSSCGKSTESTPVSKIKDEIHFAINSAPPSMDVQSITAVVGKMVTEEYIYQKLIAYDQNNQVFPELAEKFEVSADNTVYTYYLRKNVKFHNGQIMTADDVIASMNRWIDKVSAVKKIFGDSRFEKIDDSTVKVTLAAPNIFVNEMIAGCQNFPAIYPKSVVENLDPKTGNIQEFIGTGPYKFVEWAIDQYILLEKFDDYQQIENGATGGFAGPKNAIAKKIYFEFVPDDSTRVAGIQTGEYDLIYKAPYENYDLFEGNKNLQIFNAVYGDMYMPFNKKEGLGANPKIRQAIQTAIDVEEIMMGAFSTTDFYRQNGGYMLRESTSWYNEEAAASYNQKNIEKAKQLLSEAGYNGEEFRVLVTTDYTEMYNAALVIQSQLKNIGINCSLITTDWPTLVSYRTDSTKYDMFVTTGPTPVLPSTILYLSAGWAGWSADEKLQSLMNDLSVSATLDAGKNKWAEIQKYCSEEYVPTLHIGDIYRYSVGSSKVKGVEMASYGPCLWNAYVEE